MKDKRKNRKPFYMISLVLIVAAMLLLTACGGSGDESAPAGSGAAQPSGSVEQPETANLPTKFSFSGGTGKVGISCTNIEEKDGTAFATIEFSSDAYTYIRVGEKQYNCDHGDGTSFASVPVVLNENNTIFAETTKMSEAHEIEYRIFVFKDDSEMIDPYALLKTGTLDSEAPFIPGIKAAQGAEGQNGENFSLFEYENGIRLLEVKMKDALPNMLDAFDYRAYTTKAQAVEDAQARLYQGNVVKYLLVPEEYRDMIPAGIEKEAVVIITPAANAYSGDMSIEAKELVAGQYDLALLNADSLSDEETFESFAADAASLGIPVVVNVDPEVIPAALGVQ